MRDCVEDLELVKSDWAKAEDVAEIFYKYFGNMTNIPITLDMKQAMLQAILGSSVVKEEIKQSAHEKLMSIV
jgi:hypothetical protein